MDFLNSTGSVNSELAFCTVLQGTMRRGSLAYINFNSVLREIENLVWAAHPDISTNAISNCRGRWYEWLIGIMAWNYRIENNKKVLLLPLPNVRGLNIFNFLKPDLFSHVKNKMTFIRNFDVELITSNPDFILIDASDFDLTNFPIVDAYLNFDSDGIALIESFYKCFIDSCYTKDIVGFLSVKSSLRPDRRLQLAHEGSLMKALFEDLKIAEFGLGISIVKSNSPLRYYAASMDATNADITGLKTIATHSIVGDRDPMRAVDQLLVINNTASLSTALNIIIS